MMKTRIQKGKIETAKNKTIRDIWGWWGGVYISDILKITSIICFMYMDGLLYLTLKVYYD